ncbi:acyl-CoA dehydrogenase family protein [Streptomyces tsukubensis]|uniref:acyl-CoA dehydrogenase family protein n=1 Tax=Streptomyces tsukubensis TaxID=83656 RepID=UPI00344FF91D
MTRTGSHPSCISPDGPADPLAAVSPGPRLAAVHRDLRRAVAEFARDRVAPRITRMEATGEVEHGLVTEMARRGWIGVTIPAAHGGMGLGHEAKTLVIEELSRVSGAMGAAAQASMLGVAKILHFGTGEQHRQWLPAIAAGACLPTIAVTEKASGGEVLSMKATGRRKGAQWVLTGRKTFIGNSHLGHLHGVVVRTGTARDRSRRLTAFLVEHDRKGVTLAPHPPYLGLRGFSFGEVILDHVTVPDSNRIGEVGEGLDVAYSSSVLYGRLNLAAVALGIHDATRAQATSYASGRPRIAAHSTVRNRLGEIDALLRTSRLAVYHAARRLDGGLPCDADLLTAKYSAVEGVQRATALGMRIHGAAGLSAGLPMERYHRDAQCLEPPAGTADIQLHRLAEDLLSPGRHPQWSARFARPLTPPPAALAHSP